MLTLVVSTGPGEGQRSQSVVFDPVGLIQPAEPSALAGATVDFVTVVDFLISRTDEELRKASCCYEATPSGDLRCLCPRPTSETLEIIAKGSLVRRWAGSPERESLLRLLADDYVWHPDYQPEWHPVD